MRKGIFVLLTFSWLIAACGSGGGDNVCEDGERRCNGTVLEECSQDRWEIVENCDEQGMNCDLVEGVAECIERPPVCTQGQSRCNGEVVEECVDGSWSVVEDCTESGRICEIDGVSGDAGCVEAVVPCSDGESRCKDTVIEVCEEGSWVFVQDCADSEEICDHDNESGTTECIEQPCVEDETRCTDNVVQQCSGGVWEDIQDCDLTGQACTVDGSSGQASCTGLRWIHLEVEIDDPVMVGTSLQMPIDGPSFGYDPEEDLFATLYGRNFQDPDIAHIWLLDGQDGTHFKQVLSGEPFDQGENFCVGGENWCQFLAYDPVYDEWIVVAPSATTMMRVSAAGEASLAAVSGDKQHDLFIDRVHRFDFDERKLFLYGATGPSSFSASVYVFDLDTAEWSMAVDGLTQVDSNCLVSVAGENTLYSFGGRKTTDGGETTELLDTYAVIGIGTGQETLENLPEEMGARRSMSCAYDPGRNVIFVYGGCVVNDRFNEIENEYHNDLWALDLQDDSWTLVMPDTEPGIFEEPDEYGDRRFVGDVAKPNFGMHRGCMKYDAEGDRLSIMGEVPVFTHAQPYILYLDGLEDIL